MFARPSKQIPGKWQLFEYYIEAGRELLHFTEDQLKVNEIFWTIEFNHDDHFSHNCFLPVAMIAEMKDGIWNVSKNYIHFISPENFRDSIQFQFAIDKGTMKLLKKDTTGRIEFFGFFRKQT